MAKKVQEVAAVMITPPNIREVTFKVRGVSPYVQLRFSQKQIDEMKGKQAEGTTAGSKKKREPKNFQNLYEQAMYASIEGWHGINAMSFKRAMVAACRLTNMKMQMAKISLFITPDGFDKDDNIPLVKFTKGEPHYCEHIARNANGQPDIRVRAMWDAGWEADLKIKFDADRLTLNDVANLLARAGMQVGIGEGRADTTSSDGAGMGWGVFEVVAE